MTEVKKKDNGEVWHEYIGDKKLQAEQSIEELKEEVESLKELLANKVPRRVNFDKLKEALGDGSDYVLNAIRPIIERYEEPGKQAVEKVGTRVSDNPFLSVAAAFGAGIVIGTVLNFWSKTNSND
ncbi:MAG: hypothetical protein GXZ18_01620 [Synergistaceae bacterium]|jgi:ElaB/YqjD/DUF883 family membrane-anchored ribosome-binding protein|nr:hypothetical protein [Synergistaceae bacterium]